jgi:hypothetical protein
MRNYLIVANQTLGGEGLLHAVRSAMAHGECRFYVVVPAAPSQQDGAWTEGATTDKAAHRLSEGLERLRGLGAEVTGVVGDPSPMLAILDAIREQPQFDEIIVSTLPVGVSRWLRQDLPHRVQRETGLHVTHVVSAADEVVQAR